MIVAVLQREAELLTEWFCPAAGLSVDVAGYTAAWAQVLPQVDLGAGDSAARLPCGKHHAA